MPIYRKVVTNPSVWGSKDWTDVAGLSPITIQGGQSYFSFIAETSAFAILWDSREGD